MTFSGQMTTWTLEHIFKQLVYTPELPMYLGLADSLGVELVGQPGYTRVVLNPEDFSWAVDGEIANSEIIRFAVATGNWTEEIGWWTLYDALGMQLAYTQLDSLVLIKEFDIASFIVGALKITIAASDGPFAGSGGPFGVESFAMSTYLKNKWLLHIVGKEEYIPPDIWVGLLNADPGDDLTNTDCNEVAGYAINYQRSYVAPADWDAYIALVWNSVEIVFPEAMLPWGTATHFALFDSPSPSIEGNALFYGPLVPIVDIEIGSRPRFAMSIPGPDPGSFDPLGIGVHIM